MRNVFLNFIKEVEDRKNGNIISDSRK